MPSAEDHLRENVVSGLYFCAYGDTMTFIGVGFLVGFGQLSDKVSDKCPISSPKCPIRHLCRAI